MGTSDVDGLPFVMRGNLVTATFADWKRAIDVLSEFSVVTESRATSKDAMVGIQQIIVYSREARRKLGLYPRDPMPEDAVVEVRFTYDSEWGMVREVLWKFNELGREAECSPSGG